MHLIFTMKQHSPSDSSFSARTTNRAGSEKNFKDLPVGPFKVEIALITPWIPRSEPFPHSTFGGVGGKKRVECPRAADGKGRPGAREKRSVCICSISVAIPPALCPVPSVPIKFCLFISTRDAERRTRRVGHLGGGIHRSRDVAEEKNRVPAAAWGRVIYIFDEYSCSLMNIHVTGESGIPAWPRVPAR